MSDWETRQAFYKSHKSLGTQSFEDMLARRVIRGLGYGTAKAITRAEQEVLGYVNNEQPLWHRARAVYRNCIHSCDNAAMLHNMLLDAVEVKNDAEALERVDLVDTETSQIKPVLFTRIKGSKNCYAYTFWKIDELVLLTAPYTVLPGGDEPYLLFTRQELTHFIKQFAPYYNISPSED